MKITLARSIATAVALSAGIALAQPGPGYGMGPGMMGGFGPGYGMGPGMMGGFGPGYGSALDLPDAKRAELAKIEDERRSRQWALMGQMHDEMARLRDQMWAPRRDRAAISATLDRMNALHKQQIEQTLDAEERIDKLLTPEQREQLRRRVPFWILHGPGAR